MLKEIKCNLCGKEKYKILYKSTLGKEDLKKNIGFSYAEGSRKMGQIVKCNNCGLVYINPREENIENMYENLENETYSKSKNERIETFEEELKKIEKIITKKGKILDIGCASGYFLQVAKRKGWDVYGIEISKTASEEAKKLGFNIYNKKLEDCKLKDETFDVITMWDLIEHVTDPDRLLKETNRILKKEGLLVINTPDYGSILRKILRRNWPNFLRGHLYYFSHKTIKKILEKNNFKIIKIKSKSRIMKLENLNDWLKNYKILYFFSNIIIGKSFLKDVKIRINLYDNMLVYAKK